MLSRKKVKVFDFQFWTRNCFAWKSRGRPGGLSFVVDPNRISNAAAADFQNNDRPYLRPLVLSAFSFERQLYIRIRFRDLISPQKPKLSAIGSEREWKISSKRDTLKYGRCCFSNTFSSSLFGIAFFAALIDSEKTSLWIAQSSAMFQIEFGTSTEITPESECHESCN